MARPIATDLRMRTVEAYENGEGSYEDIATRFGVSTSSVTRWLRLHRYAKTVEPMPMGGSRSKITDSMKLAIQGMVDDEANWTTAELADELTAVYGLSVSRHMVGAALKSIGYTFKRGVFRPPAYRTNRVVALRESYAKEQPNMRANNLIFIDETGFIVGMNRLYGWSRRGEQAIISRRTRGKRLSVVGAMSVDGARGMMTLEGTLNTAKMLTFVDEHLGPNIQEGDIVVMDGCSVHKSKLVRAAIEKWGGKLLILPPYSPDYNPIEHLWSTMKARIRAVGSESWDALKELVDTVWSGIETEFFVNWIKHCGYTTLA